MHKCVRPVLCFLLLCTFVMQMRASTPVLEFREIWAYLMHGEEAFFDPSFPVSDIGYFGASVGTFGRLVGVPKRSKLSAYKGRVHLVVAELGNQSLTHFSLNPEYPIRDALIGDIVAASEDFDGVQLDFEAVSSRDYDNFFTFFSLLKKRLGSKTLSIALPARMSTRNDLFGYERIGKVADRVIIMAYDEHWSTGKAGPVASLEWCAKIAAYAKSTIAEEKLIMGAPFYGRAWQDTNHSRAYKYSGITNLLKEKSVESFERIDGVLSFEYSQMVRVRVFYDDLRSSLLRLEMYKSSGIQNVAFWRMGQEDIQLWQNLSVIKD